MGFRNRSYRNREHSRYLYIPRRLAAVGRLSARPLQQSGSGKSLGFAAQTSRGAAILSELEKREHSPVETSFYEYDYRPAMGRNRKYVCALVLDVGNKRRVLRAIERPVYNLDQLEKIRSEVRQRAEETAAWYRVILR